MMKRYFVCEQCSKKVNFESFGTKNRNHCPYCLYSLHVDLSVGDRASSCRGLMDPIGKIIKADGEEVLVHRCLKCKMLRKNRIAGDDSEELMNQLKVLDSVERNEVL